LVFLRRSSPSVRSWYIIGELAPAFVAGLSLIKIISNQQINMPSKLNDNSPSTSGSKVAPDQQQGEEQQQQQQHDDSQVDTKPPASAFTTTKPTKLKDLNKDDLFAFVQALKTSDDRNQHGTTSEDGVQEMYNEYDDNGYNEDENFRLFEEWCEYQRTKHLAEAPIPPTTPAFVNVPSHISVASAPAAPTTTTMPNLGGAIGINLQTLNQRGGVSFGGGGRGGGFGRGGFGRGGFGRGGSSFGRGGYPAPPPAFASSSAPMPTYVVKGSNMGLRVVARDLGDQNSAMVQLSKYDRGIGTTLLKITEQATRPLTPPLAISNYSKLLSTTFDSGATISEDVHLWQESIRQIHERAFAYDMLSIFMIPDVFDTLTYDSVHTSTKMYDSIKDFSDPELTDNHYFNWQTYVRKFGGDLELQSNTWMLKVLKSSMEPSLYSAVMLDYEDMPVHQHGAITLFRLIVNRMVLLSEEARRHLLRFIDDFDIRYYPGENVSLACVKLKEITQAIGAKKLPSDLISRVLEGFEKSTTESFRQMCSTLRISFLSSFTRSMLGTLSLQAQLTNLLRDLESAYLEIKASGKWIGAGSEGAQANTSVFNADVSDEFVEEHDEYALYKASTPANRRMPFKEWVKTATCRYCDNVGHIRPDCRRRKADLRRGLDAERSPSLPALPPATTPPANPPASQKQSPITRLRDHPQFKALKAAFDMMDSSDGETANEAHAAILEEDVSDLMCALGLKE
jgi:hypothetical protein